METYNQKNWVRRYLSHLFFCLVYFCHLIFVISSPVIGKMTKSSFLWMNWFIILFLNFFFRGFAAAVDSLTQVLGIYFYLKTFKLSNYRLVITEPLSQYFEFIWQFTYLLLTSSITAINCCLHFFFFAQWNSKLWPVSSVITLDPILLSCKQQNARFHLAISLATE